MLKMEEKKQCFWHIILHYFKKGKNATEMQKMICAVRGEGAVTDRTCQKWFAKCHAPRSVHQLKLIAIKLRH